MDNLTVEIGKVLQVEDGKTRNGSDALRVRAELASDRPEEMKSLPWAFPLLPKTFHSLPKVGEYVLIFKEVGDVKQSQRYYIGPIIPQPQFMNYSGDKIATSTLNNNDAVEPLEKITNYDLTRGAFPNSDDVAIVGRGAEDVIMKYDKDTNKSEVNIRAGIRQEPNISGSKELMGNVMFNEINPVYIQLKHKAGLATEPKQEASSVINMVGDRINLISNKDNNVNDSIHDKDTLVKDEDSDKVMKNLHQVPMGDKLVELLKIMKGAIMQHVHPWAGMEQCGDWAGYVDKLEGYDIDSILSEYVRIS